MIDVLEVNAATGEVSTRDFTPAEAEQRALDQAENERIEAEKEAAKAAHAATIQEARNHAASLGFTDAMLAVMYPNLTP